MANKSVSSSQAESFNKTQDYVLTGKIVKSPKEKTTPADVVGGVIGGAALLALCVGSSLLLCPI